MTAAPRRSAAAASPYPILPEDRFEMYRTGSIGSRVGPAVTSTRSPARSRTGVSTRRSASTMSSTSGNRPLPLRPEARAPVSGSSTVTPRPRSVATLAATAGCSHMPPSIAGTMSTGARAASRSVVRKSSAIPWAAFARRFAVAGATTTASAALGERDVLDGVGALRVEEVREHGSSRQGPERQRTHELARVLGEADRDRGTEPRRARAAGTPPCRRRSSR